MLPAAAPTLLAWLGEQYGNLASVAGLILSVATLIIASRVSKKITQAKRDILRRVQLSLLARDVSECLREADDGRRACLRRDWAHADDCLHAARLGVARFRNHAQWSADEATFLAGAVDDLRLILDAISRLRDDDAEKLSPRQMKRLDVILTRLSAVEGQLQAKLLEVPDVS